MQSAIRNLGAEESFLELSQLSLHICQPNRTSLVFLRQFHPYPNLLGPRTKAFGKTRAFVFVKVAYYSFRYE